MNKIVIHLSRGVVNGVTANTSALQALIVDEDVNGENDVSTATEYFGGRDAFIGLLHVDDCPAEVEKAFLAAGIHGIEPPLVDRVKAMAQFEGLTFADCVRAFGVESSPRIDYAREHLTSDGELEFDDYVVESGSADPGDYLMSWSWVSDSDAGIEDDGDE